MKIKILIFCSIILASISMKAQDLNPVSWKTESSYNPTTKAQKILLIATIDKGWHVFSTNPGGDGLLIPTTVKLRVNKNVKNVQDAKTNAPIHTENMEFIGVVNYYEGNVTWEINCEVVKDGDVVCEVEYQCCSNQMCLPPTQKEFTITLKK